MTDRQEEEQVCGHHVSAIESGDEGATHCAECEQQSRIEWEQEQRAIIDQGWYA